MIITKNSFSACFIFSAYGPLFGNIQCINLKPSMEHTDGSRPVVTSLIFALELSSGYLCWHRTAWLRSLNVWEEQLAFKSFLNVSSKTFSITSKDCGSGRSSVRSWKRNLQEPSGLCNITWCRPGRHGSHGFIILLALALWRRSRVRRSWMGFSRWPILWPYRQQFYTMDFTYHSSIFGSRDTFWFSYRHCNSGSKKSPSTNWSKIVSRMLPAEGSCWCKLCLLVLLTENNNGAHISEIHNFLHTCFGLGFVKFLLF